VEKPATGKTKSKIINAKPENNKKKGLSVV